MRVPSSRLILGVFSALVCVAALLLSNQFRTDPFFAGGGQAHESLQLESAKFDQAKPFGQMPAAAGAGSLGVAGISQTSTTEDGIVDVPVVFKVSNTNSSAVPCPTDAAEYEVHGHLVGPVDALSNPDHHPVVLHTFGMDEGEWIWRFRLVPGYDYSREMAKRGHVSVTIDLVGYGQSGKPHGYLTCMGAQADMIHQIIQELRGGTYEVEGVLPISFKKVILVGTDTGGAMVEIESYSFKDIDGLVIWLWADQGFSSYITQLFATNIAKCAASESPDGHGVSGGGYLLFGPTSNDQFRKDLIYDAEEKVAEGIVASRNRNPCGHAYSPPANVTARVNQQRLKEVTVPVLLMYPTKDPVFTLEGQQQQVAHFSGTNDVTTTWFESGHLPMLERVAPDFRKTFSQWLKERW